MPELPRWASIPDSHDYLISDEGQVRRLMPDGTWREIRATRNGGGYLKLDVWTGEPGHRRPRTEYVHRLVMFAFGPPEPQDDNTWHVDHINHCTTDNRLPNLRWRLAEENQWDWADRWIGVPA